MLFVYSGNFSCEAEKDQIQPDAPASSDLNEELFSYPLAAGETFTVPEVILSYSADGLSHSFHISTTPASVSMCAGADLSHEATTGAHQ